MALSLKCYFKFIKSIFNEQGLCKNKTSTLYLNKLKKESFLLLVGVFGSEREMITTHTTIPLKWFVSHKKKDLHDGNSINDGV